MSHFILEIGIEEMPARFLPILEQALQDGFAQRLADARLTHGVITTLSTPRRLFLDCTDMAEVQEREEVEVTGPPARIAFDDKGEPTKAGLGFARSQQVDMKDVYVTDTGKGEYLAVRKIRGGEPARKVLGPLCQDMIAHLPFPKKMHWEASRFTFGRPLRWLLALLDSEVVPFALAGLEAGIMTWGHRVLGPGPFSVKEADAYPQVIRDQGKVVLDHEERVSMILARGNELAQEVGGTIAWDEGLIHHVANLVENPVPVLGHFDPAYLELPEEVLLTSMETHQKSFGVKGPDGSLLPRFLTVINGEPLSVDVVRKGWERVLKARLEDAMFFWKADLGTTFATWMEKLEEVTFLGPLGSMGDKSRRLARLAQALAQDVAPEQAQELARAGRLAKGDLVSEMVYEFDTLQGIMGGMYAAKQGEGQVVAQALAEQYLPAGQDSPCPATLGGAILAMADKLDTLAGCFGIGNIPTGAADPFALRRCTLGVCRILLEHGIRTDLTHIMRLALEGYEGMAWKRDEQAILDKLMDFFAQRLRHYWVARGWDGKVVDAAIGAGINDVVALEKRIKALADCTRKEDFDQAVLTFKRVHTIIRKQGQEAGVTFTGTVNPELLVEDAEHQLHAHLAARAEQWESLWGEDDFAGLLQELWTLRPMVDRFFDTVMVMCDEADLRANRLNMLYNLVRCLGRLADFSALQV